MGTARFNTRLMTVVIAAAFLDLPVTSAQGVEKIDVLGIRNFSRVDVSFACGGATSVQALQELRQQGFRAVVNFRLSIEPGADIEASKAAAAVLGLRYFHLPFSTRNPDPAVVDLFLEAVSNRDNQPMFIHCSGANRAAGIWFIKRIVLDRWSVDDAMKEADAIGLTSLSLRQFALDYVASYEKR